MIMKWAWNVGTKVEACRFVIETDLIVIELTYTLACSLLYHLYSGRSIQCLRVLSGFVFMGVYGKLISMVASEKYILFSSFHWQSLHRNVSLSFYICPSVMVD